MTSPVGQRTRVGALAGRLPRGRTGEALAVAGAYVVTAVYLVSRAVEVRSYIWLVDELLYTKGALGYAAGTLGGHVYGQAQSVHAPLYSWLLAPIYGLLNSDHAFKAAHAVDALVFAAVLVPVYLTARYLGARPLMALLAGLLSVWVPWSAATLVLMSESLAYLTFAWAVWAMVRALAEPSPGRDGIALVLIAATAYTRPQFALLFPAFGLAAILCAVRTEDRGSLRGHAERHWVIGAAALIGLVVVAIAGPSLLGGYSHTSGLPRFPPGLWQNMLSHASHVVVGAGVIPAIAWLAWVLRAGGAPSLGRRELAFAVLSGLLVVLVFYEVGFFSQNVVGGRIQERTAFYVVPLFALGLAALSADQRPRTPRLSLIAAATAVALVIGAAAFSPAEAAGPFEAIANPGASYNSELHNAVANVSDAVLGHALPTTEGLALLALAFGVAATLLAAPRFRRVGLPLAAAATLVFCVVETTTVLARDVRGVNAAIPGALGSANPPKAWVDGALYGKDGDAGALESPLAGADSYTVWLWVEFWNKSVTRLYVPRGGHAYSELPALPFDLDEQTGAIKTPLEKRYLVVSGTDPRFALQGSVFKKGPFGLDILEPARPYRAAWALVNPLALAVYRPSGAQTVTARFTLTRTAGARSPASAAIHAGARVTRVRLAAGEQSHAVSVQATIPAGAARALVTVGTRAKLAIRNVAVRRG